METFFSKLYRQTSFHRKNASTTFDTSVTEHLDDREDDGFLLIGQTPSELRSRETTELEVSASNLKVLLIKLNYYDIIYFFDYNLHLIYIYIILKSN